MSALAGLFSTISLVLVAISVHEFAHAWAANALGDPTARYRGRVTLDPLAHLDPIGTLMILFSSLTGYGIGWGRPVPVIPSNLKPNPSLGLALASGSGPLSNLGQAVVAATLLHVARALLPSPSSMTITVSNIGAILAGAAGLASGGLLLYQWFRQRAIARPAALGSFYWKIVPQGPDVPLWKNEDLLKNLVRGALAGLLLFGFGRSPQGMLLTAVYVNLALALFNLIPLGPLDGSGIARGLLLNIRARWAYRAAGLLDRIEPFSVQILFGLIFVQQVLGIPVLSWPIWGGARLIARLLGV